MGNSKILIVAYEFYPTNTGGSHRPFRIANFLKQNGIEPIVISGKDQNLEQNFDPSLESILSESNLDCTQIPLKKEGRWSKISKSYYLNIFDDTYQRWKSELLPHVLKTIEKHNISTILVTAPPFSLVKLLSDLRITKLNLSLILDMRDAWSQWNVSPYASKIHYLLTKRFENKSFQLANKILVTSQVTLTDFKTDHQNIDPAKFLYIPNSFEELKKEPSSSPTGDEINIGYVGSFYFNPTSERLNKLKWYQKKPMQWFQYTPTIEEWIYRSPFFIFQTFKLLIDNHPQIGAKIKIHFAGIKPYWMDEMISSFGLSGHIIHHGKLAKQEIKEFQNNLDFVLITSAKRHNKKDYSIAGKTFEYFSEQNKILAFVTESAQKDILTPSGLSFIMNPDDPEGSVKLLLQIFLGEKKIEPDTHYLSQYQTKNALIPLLELLKHRNSK